MSRGSETRSFDDIWLNLEITTSAGPDRISLAGANIITDQEATSVSYSRALLVMTQSETSLVFSKPSS